MDNIENIKKTIDMFFMLPLHVEIVLIAFFLGCLSIIVYVLTIPVFNYIVIPIIEKNINKKLNFTFFGLYDFYPFGRFFGKHVEIVKYIVLKHWALKCKGSENYINFGNQYALQNVNYKVENSSKFVIVISYIVAINYFVMIASVGIGGIIAAFYKR